MAPSPWIALPDELLAKHVLSRLGLRSLSCTLVSLAAHQLSSTGSLWHHLDLRSVSRVQSPIEDFTRWIRSLAARTGGCLRTLRLAGAPAARAAVVLQAVLPVSPQLVALTCCGASGLNQLEPMLEIGSHCPLLTG